MEEEELGGALSASHARNTSVRWQGMLLRGCSVQHGTARGYAGMLGFGTGIGYGATDLERGEVGEHELHLVLTSM
eukprot:3254716-Rhodomonas_salina.1